MGAIVLRSIVVTADNEEDILLAHENAVELGLRVTNITPSVTNGYTSFMIVPSGSKCGWDTNIEQGKLMDKFIDWIKWKPVAHWVEIQYGPDAAGVTVIDHN